MDERGKGLAVFGIGLIEEKDAISGATNALIRVPGQGFEAAADDGGRAQWRLTEDPLDLLQRRRGRRVFREVRLGDEAMDGPEMRVGDPGGLTFPIRRGVPVRGPGKKGPV